MCMWCPCGVSRPKRSDDRILVCRSVGPAGSRAAFAGWCEEVAREEGIGRVLSPRGRFPSAFSAAAAHEHALDAAFVRGRRRAIEQDAKAGGRPEPPVRVMRLAQIAVESLEAVNRRFEAQIGVAAAPAGAAVRAAE